ncbi:MAG: DEAD/DEAH box helicase family protein, partial [Hyphomicrobium sp.]
MELRPYQLAGIEAVEHYLSAGGPAGLIVWPTGAGKSVALAAIAEYIVSRGGRVLIVSHVAEPVSYT